MSSLPHVSYKNFKRFAKVLSKRLEIQLSLAQENLVQASGYRDLHQLQAMRSVPGLDPRRDAPWLAAARWMSRMRAIFGPDLVELFNENELVGWCRQIHRRLEGDAEVDDTDLASADGQAQGER